MDFYKLAKIGAKAHWEKYNLPIANYIAKTSHKFKIEKARIIGFLMGDGSITTLGKPASRQQHDVSFYPDNKKMLNLFLKDFEKVYLKKPRVKNNGKYFSARVSSKPACDDLRSFGNFTSLNWQFPKKLKTKNEKKEWLKAIFDCEAYVETTKRKRICIQSISKKGIGSVKRLLKEFGINSKTYEYERENPQWNKNYLLFIMGKENIIKYSNLVGFNHSKKQKKLITFAGVPER